MFKRLLSFFFSTYIAYFFVGGGLHAEMSDQSVRIPKSIPQHVSYDRFDLFLNLKKSQPKITISVKENWIISTGSHKISRQNRKLVDELLAEKNADRPFLLNIKMKLLKIKKHDALFFPVIFNLGRVYQMLGDYKYAILAFRKVTHVVSQYWLGFFYLAKSHELAGDIDKAIQNFRLSYEKNPFELIPLIALGDLHLAHKKYNKGELVYRHCLSIDPDYNNAIIGLGKIAFYQKKYNYATLWFRRIDTEKSFNKKMHFYYAESSFFIHDYDKAVREYEMALLNYNLGVFSNISRRWLLQRKTQAESLFKANQ